MDSVSPVPTAPSAHRQVDMPALADAAELRNITDVLERRVAGHPDVVAFQVRHPAAPFDAPWEPVTTAAFHARVRALAKGLIALGIRPGDAVSIVSATRYEWTLMDLACLYAGAVVVPMFDSAPQSQMAAIADVAGVRAAFAGSPAAAVPGTSGPRREDTAPRANHSRF